MTIELYKNIRNYLRELIRGTEWEGHVYTVGGCCRDEIMGLPIKDIDLAVDLPNGGVRFAEWLHKKKKTVCRPTVFIAFGTAKLLLSKFPDYEIELVQTRSEKYVDRNSRNPEVAYGSLEDDCFRRDLTINSLYYDISRDCLLDMTGHGVDDIMDKRLRTPMNPEFTYDDDPLRILRCIRFASRLGWEISPDILEAMSHHVDRLPIIKFERISNELASMLTGPDPVRAMELLRSTGAMKHIIPELCATYDLKIKPDDSATIWQHTLKVVETAPPDLVVRVAALFHEIGKTLTPSAAEKGGHRKVLRYDTLSETLTKQIMKRLRFYPPIGRPVSFLVLCHTYFKYLDVHGEKLKDKDLRRIQYLSRTKERFEQLLSLIEADDRVHSKEDRMPDKIARIRARSEELEKNGTAMFGYKLPIPTDEIRRIMGLKSKRKLRACIEHVMKLACSNPDAGREDFILCLKEYKAKINK